MIRALPADEAADRAEALAEVLLDCIAGGASVSFMHDFSRAEAVAYWRSIASDVASGRRGLFEPGRQELRWLLHERSP